MRPLPVAVTPHDDETWRSYLTRCAAAQGATAAALAEHLQLRDRGRWPSNHGVFIDRALAARTAPILGINEQAIHAMQLSNYDGAAFDPMALLLA